MIRKFSKSRRTFLKTSAASAAGIAAVGVLPKDVLAKQGDWIDGMRINPLIDNLRVVSCKDQRMLPSLPTNWTNFTTVNSFFNSAQIYANLDEMAKALAGKSTAGEAWAAIFQKPAGKEFSAARVAIKVNCIEPRLMTCVAVINKIADELNRLGVPYANMMIYDGCSNASGKYSTNNVPLSILKAGIKVSSGNTMFNIAPGTVSAPVPAPFNGSVACTKEIANGTIDILINTAVNKGHGSEYGGITLSMKNHYGTFEPNSVHGYNGYIGVTKSDAIIGGTPPRQQLVVIDSLAQISYSNSGSPDKFPYRLVMGTFSPAVDYVTAKKIRGTEMGTAPSADIEKIMLEFGYTPQERDAMVLTDVTPVSVGGSGNYGYAKNSKMVGFRVTGADVKTSTIKIPFSREKVQEVSIYNMQGKQVRSILRRGSADSETIYWNGKSDVGESVVAGTYVVSLKGETFERSEKFVLRR